LFPFFKFARLQSFYFQIPHFLPNQRFQSSQKVFYKSSDLIAHSAKPHEIQTNHDRGHVIAILLLSIDADSTI